MEKRKSNIEEIRIHIGAHKTATTHFQDSLAHLYSDLLEDGITYLARTQYRKTLAQLMPFGLESIKYKMRLGTFKTQFINRVLLDNIPQNPKLLISEENIMGGPEEACEPVPYPNMEKRLDFIKHLDRTHLVKIYLSIRSFDRLLPGAYVTGLRFDPIVAKNSKEQLIKGLDEKRYPSWMGIVKRVKRVLPNCQLNIWTQEQYRKSSDAIIRAFSGAKIETLPKIPPPVQTMTPSFDAVDKVETMLTGLDKKPKGWKGIVDNVFVELPANEPSERFTFLNQSQITALQNQYSKDIEELRQEYPGCFLVTEE